MEGGSREISLKEKLDFLKTLLLQKGYSSSFFEEEVKFYFSYQNYSFLVFLPLIVREKFQTLLIIDIKHTPSLISLERGLLALARTLFKPLPYFALLTNFNDYHLIEVSSGKCLRGSEEVIPEYLKVKSCPFILKPFKKELEERILAIYLSGG